MATVVERLADLRGTQKGLREFPATSEPFESDTLGEAIRSSAKKVRLDNSS